MNEFNDWWNDKMTNKHQNSNLQFTELTPDDIAIMEDLYIEELLVGGLGVIYGQLYYNYATKELQKANEMFIKEFGSDKQ